MLFRSHAACDAWQPIHPAHGLSVYPGFVRGLPIALCVWHEFLVLLAGSNLLWDRILFLCFCALAELLGRLGQEDVQVFVDTSQWHLCRFAD